MDTSYNDFNYHNVFQYNYNIFKNNYNVGIGTSIPKHNLDIKGNFSSSNNININGDLLYKNYNSNELNLLEYNVNTNIVTSLKLVNQSNTFNNNKYTWSLNNNNLKLDFHNKNDNTIIPYQSLPYETTETICIYSKYTITITHLYIYKITNKSNNDYSITTDNNNITKIVCNSTDYEFTSQEPLQNNYYKLNTSIEFTKNNENILTIIGGASDYYIIFLGKYNFNDGLLWNNNTSGDLFINNNVGIGTNTNYNTQLYIDKSTQSTNTEVYNTINTHNSHLTSINNENSSNIDFITSNKLVINSTKQNVGIGTPYTNDFLNIAGEFIVNHNSNTYFNNVSFMNNINFGNNINISLNNKPLIIFTNNNNDYELKLNHIHNLSNKICIKNNLNLINTANNQNSNYNSNNSENVTDNTHNILNINGNANITNNIVVGGTLKINNLTNLEAHKELQVINYKNTSNLLNKGYTYANYISTPHFKTKYLTVPNILTTDNKTVGGLYYDKTLDRYVGNNENDIVFLDQFRANNIKPIFDYKLNGKTDLLYTNTKHINTHNINITQKFILPKTSTYSVTNYDKSNIGTIRFNTNTLYPQIHNGYNWCSIKYNNTQSQLNYVSFDVLSGLTPSFHNRKLNYQYTETTKPTFVTFSINPYSVLNILFKQSNSLIHQQTITNTSTQHISQNIDIKTNIQNDFNNLELISEKINSNTTINYTCSFSYINNLLENFIAKYEYFTLNLKNNTLDIFKLTASLIPSNLIYNNIFQANATNLQLNSGQKPHIEDKLYRKDIQNIFYNRTTKKFRRNYYNKLYELYYNTTLTKLKMVFIKNLLANQNGLFEHELNNVKYDESSNKLLKIEHNIQYNIVYHDEQFLQAVTSVILNTPIMNSNNKINYQIIDPKLTLDYNYKELYETDITSTNYRTKNYDINYNINDHQFYLENIGNSHKFKIVGQGDNVVAALEYISCKLKQFNT